MFLYTNPFLEKTVPEKYISHPEPIVVGSLYLYPETKFFLFVDAIDPKKQLVLDAMDIRHAIQQLSTITVPSNDLPALRSKNLFVKDSKKNAQHTLTLTMTQYAELVRQAFGSFHAIDPPLLPTKEEKLYSIPFLPIESVDASAENQRKALELHSAIQASLEEKLTGCQTLAECLALFQPILTYMSYLEQKLLGQFDQRLEHTVLEKHGLASRVEQTSITASGMSITLMRALTPLEIHENLPSAKLELLGVYAKKSDLPVQANNMVEILAMFHAGGITRVYDLVIAILTKMVNISAASLVLIGVPHDFMPDEITIATRAMFTDKARDLVNQRSCNYEQLHGLVENTIKDALKLPNGKLLAQVVKNLYTLVALKLA